MYVLVHGKSWEKMKTKLKELSSRRSFQSIHPSLKKIEAYMRGWLNYYRIADMKNRIEDLNSVNDNLKPEAWKNFISTENPPVVYN